MTISPNKNKNKYTVAKSLWTIDQHTHVVLFQTVATSVQNVHCMLQKYKFPLLKLKGPNCVPTWQHPCAERAELTHGLQRLDCTKLSVRPRNTFGMNQNMTAPQTSLIQHQCLISPTILQLNHQKSPTATLPSRGKPSQKRGGSNNSKRKLDLEWDVNKHTSGMISCP